MKKTFILIFALLSMPLSASEDMSFGDCADKSSCISIEMVKPIKPDTSFQIECKNQWLNGLVYDPNKELMYAIHCSKVYDRNGERVGKIDAKGKIVDMNDKYFGHIDENDDFYDEKSNKVGLWTAKDSTPTSCINEQYNGDVYDENEELLYIIRCAKVYDRNGEHIGYIDEYGQLYDFNNSCIGYLDEDKTC